MSDLKVSLVLQLKNLLGRGIGQVRGELKGLKDEAKGLAGIKGPNAAGLAAYGREAHRSAAALRELKREQAILGAGRAAGNTILAGTGRAALALGGLTVARAAIKESINFEQAMAQVKKKVDGAEDPTVFAAIERDVKRMAQAYGIAQVEMAKLVAEAGASGIAVKDLSQFMNLAAKASVGWDMSAQETAQVLAQIKAGSQMSTSEVGDLADMINYLGDSSAAKERDIVEMFQRAGEAAKAAGSDTKTTLAFLTGARAMGIGTEIGGRFFGAFTSKLVNVSKKGKEALKGLGLSVEEIKKGMEKNPFETMISVLDKLKGSARRAEFAKDLFGAEWFDEALRLAGGINEVKKAYQGLQNAGNWRGSLDKGLNIELATTQNHINRLKAAAQDVGDRLSRWTLGPINAGAEKLLDLMDRLRGKTKSGTEKEASDGDMKQVSEYESGARIKDDSAADLRKAAKTTKNKKDRETLLQRAANLEKEAVDLRERADYARERARAGARTAQSERNEFATEAEREAIKKRLRQISSGMNEDGSFKTPAQKAEHDEQSKRLKEIDKAAEERRQSDAQLRHERIQKERRESGADQKRQGLERLQGILGQAAPGQDFVRDPKTGANWNVEKLRQEIQRLQQQLGEIGPEAAKTGATIKDKLTMDLTGEGSNAAASFAAGFTSASGTAIAAAQSLAAQLRATLSTPAAASPATGGRPATGGGARGGGGAPTVQVGSISVHGSGDPEKAAKLVEQRLASAIRSGLQGAHHDGVT